MHLSTVVLLDLFTDYIEKTTPTEPQEPTAGNAPVDHEPGTEVAHARRSPSPSEDAQLKEEDVAVEEEEQKEEEST